MHKNAWLAFSAAANVILLGVVLTLAFNRVTQVPPKPAAVSAPHSTRAGQPIHSPSTEEAGEARMQSAEVDATATTAAGMPDNLAQPLSFTFASGRAIQFPAEFVALVKRLQAAGVSDELLAGLIQTELGRQLSAAQQEIQRKIRRGEIDQREQMRFYADRQNVQKEAVKSLLGEEAYVRVERQAAVRWAEIAGLSLTPDQAVAAYQVAREYGQGGQRGQDISAAFQSGEIDQIDYQERQAQLQKEFEQQMTGLIGTEAFADLKRSTDWNYGNMRRQLRDLSLSDGQFDSLYAAMQQSGQKQQELTRLNQAGKLQPQEYSQQRIALNKEQEEEYRRILGTDGYAQYQKVTDSRYQQLKQYAPAWQLSQADIEHVYQSLTQAAQAVQEYQQQARASTTPGQPVNWQEMQKATEDYKRQAEEELHQYLGEERFAKLKRAGVIRMDYITTGSRTIYGTGSYISAPFMLY